MCMYIYMYVYIGRHHSTVGLSYEDAFALFRCISKGRILHSATTDKARQILRPGVPPLKYIRETNETRNPPFKQQSSCQKHHHLAVFFRTYHHLTTCRLRRLIDDPQPLARRTRP